MHLSKQHLKQLINEEYNKLLSEQETPGYWNQPTENIKSAWDTFLDAAFKHDLKRSYMPRVPDKPYLAPRRYPGYRQHKDIDTPHWEQDLLDTWDELMVNPGAMQDWVIAYKDPYHPMHREAVSAQPAMAPVNYLYPAKQKEMLKYGEDF